jgi:hypothetical protein
MKEVYWLVDGVIGGRCGPAVFPWDPRELYAGGVRAIVSLDPEGVDEDELRAAGIEHLPLYQPMILLLDEAERREFLRCLPPVLRFVDRMRARQAPVVLHCYYGCDRTGALLACYLMAREGATAEEAIRRVRRARPGAMSALGYVEAVTLFEKIKHELDVPGPAGAHSGL